MAALKRIVLFVEGEGDEEAVPILVRHLLNEMKAWDALFLDPKPFRVGELGRLARHDGKEWVRFLKAAARERRNLGGVLLLLDGDLKGFREEQYCAKKAAQFLSERAREAGAGILFSVATVFALQEYESWLIAGIDTLAGKKLPDGRPGVCLGATCPEGDLEVAPRGAKGWLQQHMASGYKPTVDQAPLTKLLLEDLASIRARNMRSFRRLESALEQLVRAIRSGKHALTPALESAPDPPSV